MLYFAVAYLIAAPLFQSFTFSALKANKHSKELYQETQHIGQDLMYLFILQNLTTSALKANRISGETQDIRGDPLYFPLAPLLQSFTISALRTNRKSN